MPAENEPDSSASGRRPTGVPFRVRLTVALLLIATIPVGVFGFVVATVRTNALSQSVLLEVLVLTVAAAAMIALVVAYLLSAELTRPLAGMASAVERLAAGEVDRPVPVTGDDELARLAESHNRVAAAAQRRNAELSALLAAVSEYAPRRGAERLAEAARMDACRIFGLIDAQIYLDDPIGVDEEERVPGEPLPVRATIRAGTDALGVLTGHLPATRSWQRADQDLLELFASEVGVALRNAELFARIEDQNAQLVALDEAKDEFLRGVSHNLQTPLTSIRAYADQLRAGLESDQATIAKLDIITEQADRLTRLVRQLLTVTRIDAGVLTASPDVIGLGRSVRRAWEALGRTDIGFVLDDRSGGWLAVADPDQLDQILWALLDNAIKYGGTAGPVEATIALDARAKRLSLTIRDHGPGVSPDDRARLFLRFSRGSEQVSGGGTGLGLYVSRELAWAMGGDLCLDETRSGNGPGAAFTLTLPGEMPVDEG